MKPYVIAEMGVNFYDTAKKLNINPLEAAKMYIDAAAEAGIDCAKFHHIKLALSYLEFASLLGLDKGADKDPIMSCF